jgi:hypothetical protein
MLKIISLLDDRDSSMKIIPESLVSNHISLISEHKCCINSE